MLVVMSISLKNIFLSLFVLKESNLTFLKGLNLTKQENKDKYDKNINIEG